MVLVAGLVSVARAMFLRTIACTWDISVIFDHQNHAPCAVFEMWLAQVQLALLVSKSFEVVIEIGQRHESIPLETSCASCILSAVQSMLFLQDIN